MSDYLKTRRKVQEGIDWRGDVSVTIDGDEHNLKVRQPTDEEYFEVLDDINRDALKQYRDEAPIDDFERLRELREIEQSDEGLSEDEREEYEELQESLEDEEDLFDYIDKETFNAMRRLAKYCVVPDSDDVEDVAQTPVGELKTRLGDIVDEYTGPNGGLGRDRARGLIKEDMENMVDNMTNFSSFELGLKVFEKALSTEDDEGN